LTDQERGQSEEAITRRKVKNSRCYRGRANIGTFKKERKKEKHGQHWRGIWEKELAWERVNWGRGEGKRNCAKVKEVGTYARLTEDSFERRGRKEGGH